MLGVLPILLTASVGVSADELPIYIGTYTSAAGSKGIYRTTLNVKTGRLTEPTLAAPTINPSFVALHPDGKHLYAVHENREGKVSAFAIDGERLRYLNTQPATGPDPCHISVDKQGRRVFVASYSGGDLAALPIQPDGSLGSVNGKFQNEGSGPDESRQKGPHMHCATVDPTGRFVYACDLGTDDVLAFAVDGDLSRPDHRTLVPRGGGPRHIAFSQDGSRFYVNSEMTCAVTPYVRKGNTLTLHRTLSTLPEGTPLAGNSTAEIELHPNGRWLYVSNRGHDSLAVFDVQPDGSLKLSGIDPLGVKGPRSFAIDPSGRWLVVSGQHSDDVAVLAISPESGRVTPQGAKIKVDAPVCVAFGR